MTAQYWCELAWLGGSGAAEGVVITIDGDRITEVRAGVPACPPEALPLAGLTLPALANAHSHAFHRALRGRTHAGRGNFWTWRDLMYRVAARLDPDCYYRLARAVFAEMALAGIGVVGEFHYVHHRPGGGNYDDPDAMGRSRGGRGPRRRHPPDPARHAVSPWRARPRARRRLRAAGARAGPVQRRQRRPVGRSDRGPGLDGVGTDGEGWRGGALGEGCRSAVHQGGRGLGQRARRPAALPRLRAAGGRTSSASASTA